VAGLFYQPTCRWTLGPPVAQGLGVHGRGIGCLRRGEERDLTSPLYEGNSPHCAAVARLFSRRLQSAAKRVLSRRCSGIGFRLHLSRTAASSCMDFSEGEGQLLSWVGVLSASVLCSFPEAIASLNVPNGRSHKLSALRFVRPLARPFGSLIGSDAEIPSTRLC